MHHRDRVPQISCMDPRSHLSTLGVCVISAPNGPCLILGSNIRPDNLLQGLLHLQRRAPLCSSQWDNFSVTSKCIQRIVQGCGGGGLVVCMVGSWLWGLGFDSCCLLTGGKKLISCAAWGNNWLKSTAKKLFWLFDVMNFKLWSFKSHA